MSSARKQRWTLLVLMLGLTLSATALVSQNEGAAEEAEVAPAVEPVTEAAQPPVAEQQNPEPVEEEATIHLEKLQRHAADAPVADLFAAKSWYVPPPPPKPLPPPPPSAPPLPFSYMGKLIEDEQMTIFLTKQDRNYVVKSGDTIDGTYKVEEVSARTMTLTYLPLNIRQTLMIGGE